MRLYCVTTLCSDSATFEHISELMVIHYGKRVPLLGMHLICMLLMLLIAEVVIVRMMVGVGCDHGLGVFGR